MHVDGLADDLNRDCVDEFVHRLFFQPTANACRDEVSTWQKQHAKRNAHGQFFATPRGEPFCAVAREEACEGHAGGVAQLNTQNHALGVALEFRPEFSDVLLAKSHAIDASAFGILK